MAELKRKVTLRRKSDIVATLPGSGNGKSKLLITIIIIGLLVVLISGYFLMKPSPITIEESLQAQAGTEDVVTNDTPVTDQLKAQLVSNDQSSLATSSDAVTLQPQSNTEPTAVAQTSIPTQTKARNAAIELPYKKGEAYKIYQFPFGVADYSQPNLELDRLADVMKQNPTMKISISAFTDNVGDVNYNQTLSEQRAKAIRDYLVSKGIDQNRLAYIGKGISTQFPSNAENRRAEFILT